MIRALRSTVAATLALLVTACAVGETIAPTTPSAARIDAPGQSVRFLQRGAAAPSFKGETVVLTASAGAASTAILHFADGTPFAEFRVGARTLAGATLQGRPLARGTQVTITMTAADNHRFIVDMQPAGIVFNPAAPAELSFHYGYADVKEGDSPISVWKQERGSDPWESVSGRDDRSSRRVTTPVYGFTKYAAAYGRSEPPEP